MAYACIYGPDPVTDLPGLIEVAERSVPTVAGGERVVGAALYRAGRYEQALERFEQSHKVFQPRAWDWLFLAMIHSRLGHADEAARTLEEAADWIVEADTARRRKGEGSARAGTSLFEAPLTRLLRKRGRGGDPFRPDLPGRPVRPHPLRSSRRVFGSG